MGVAEREPSPILDPARWPLVGRSSELEAVAEALSGAGVVLAGPAGVGKTRLAREAVLRTGADPVLRIAARPSVAAVPLVPFAPLLADGPGALAAIDTATAVRAALTERWTGAGPPVLVVDDAQWLDGVSAAVLLQLAGDHGVRLVVTLRQGEAALPEVVALWAEELLRRIELGPMGEAELRGLLLAALDGPVEEASLRAMLRTSAGNVLYLRELLLGSVDAGTLVVDHGVWRLTAPLGSTPRLADLVGGRLGGLDRDGREALELLACAGALDLATLVALVGADVVERLERSGLLLAGGGTVGTPVMEVAHPLHAEVLRDQLPAAARARISAQLLEAGPDGAWDALRPDQRMQRSVWHLDAGLPVAGDRLFAAAHDAVTAGDQALAARLATAAFDAGGPVDAVVLAAWCLGELGERVDAEHLLAQALAASTSLLDQAEITSCMVEDRYWADDDPDGADELADRFLDGPARGDRAAGDRVRAQRPILTLLGGRVDAALAAAEPHLGSPDPVVALRAALPWCIGTAFSGRCGEARAAADTAFERALAESAHHRVNPGPFLVAAAWSRLNDADLVGARGIAELVYSEASRRPGWADRGWASSFLGLVLGEAGELEEAVRFLVEAEAMWRRAGVPAFARVVIASRSLWQLQLGRRDLARAALLSAGEPRTMRFMDVTVERAHAWLDWVEGRREPAVERLEGAVALGVAQGARVLAAQAAHDLSRLGRPDLAVAAFARLGGFSDAALPRLLADDAAARAEEEVAALTASSDALGAAGFGLLAAEAAELGARVARRRGATRDAARLQARAASLLDAVGRPTTVLLGAAPERGTLSRREREVATLAADGLTNRQIAEVLVLSERTVENHLYRVFAKLGVSSREELGSALG